MLPKERIITFQKLFLNIWPPKEIYFLNGWVITLTGGLTGRSNSILTFDYTGDDLDEDIEIVEAFYRNYNLPVRFKLADYFSPPDLEERLFERGYRNSNYSLITMGCNIQTVKLRKSKNDEFSIEFTEQMSSEFSNFLTEYSSNLTEDQQIMAEVTKRIVIPKKRFILAKEGKNVVGTVMAVFDPQGNMYLAELFVHPDYRRRKIGLSLVTEAMEWGMSCGVTNYWLHVERDNKKAIELYENLEFQKWYSYKYLLKK
jgi:ribosomal protein S18 acetylase RimI-like enzyme